MRCLLIAAALLLLAVPAVAQQAELEAVTDAADELFETQQELDVAQRRLARLQVNDCYNQGAAVRKLCAELEVQIGELTTEATSERQVYDQAVAAYQSAMRPRIDLMRSALEAHRYIGATSASERVKRRAQGAIERDLPQLGVPVDIAGVAAEIESLIASAASDTSVAQIIDRITANDPDLGAILQTTYSQLHTALMELPATERIQKWNEALGWVGKFATALRAAGITTPGSRPAERDLQQLVAMVELTGALEPGAVLTPGFGFYVTALKMMLGEIVKSAVRIDFEKSKFNLQALVDYAASDSPNEDIDELPGVSDRLGLFALLGPNPKIVPDSPHFEQDAAVTGTWGGWKSRHEADEPWLGVFRKAEAPESKWADDNDPFDVDYIRVVSATGLGKFSFDLDPGEYVLRMFDGESGAKVAEAAVIVRSNETEGYPWHWSARNVSPLSIIVCGGSSGHVGPVVYGTDRYEPGSTLCHSAVHAGVATLESGGRFRVIWHDPDPNVTIVGSERNGILSSGSGHKGQTFSVEAVQ
jgi:hypothetical protein